MSKFPKGFLIGAATAAHQVEGNNIYSDCWAQEQMSHSTYKEKSGIACDHYHRYAEDIRLMKQAGLNAYRFSIEWARIQPEEGVFDRAQIEHYRDVIRACKENGIEPVVTLFHFSSPAWIIRKGGWEADSIVADFKSYAAYVVDNLGSELTISAPSTKPTWGFRWRLSPAGMSRWQRQLPKLQRKAAGRCRWA